MNWPLFFRPGTRVLALPSWRSPRLFLPADTACLRWATSAFYPAFRLRARAFRATLRLRAATGLSARVGAGEGWALGAFVQDALPQTAHAAALVGAPSPIQKITLQLRNADLSVIGYLKYAERPAAQRRLRQEHHVLQRLPAGLGPRPLKYGSLGDGEALLVTPLTGRTLRPHLPPPADLQSLLQRLAAVAAEAHPVDDHPYIVALRRASAVPFDAWLEPLRDRPWPTVVQHGDLTPWNILRRPDDTLAAVDWEQASLHGFPLLDRCYYLLQVAALLPEWPAAKAAAFATQQLLACDLSARQARALVRLAALDAFCRSARDGQPPQQKLQAWRRAVWET